jgi:hypothetical protein
VHARLREAVGGGHPEDAAADDRDGGTAHAGAAAFAERSRAIIRQ